MIEQRQKIGKFLLSDGRFLQAQSHIVQLGCMLYLKVGYRLDGTGLNLLTLSCTTNNQ